MRDVTVTAETLFDAGFEAGSLAAANALLGWLHAQGHVAAVAAARAAWESGSMFLADPVAVAAEPFDGRPALMARADSPEAPHLAGVPTASSQMGQDQTITGGPYRLKRGEAQEMGFTGDACGACGGMRMKRSGTCATCQDCFQTTGCS